MKFIATIAFAASFLFSSAQSQTRIYAEKIGSVNPREMSSGFDVKLKYKAPQPDGKSYGTFIQGQKRKVEASYPRKNYNRGGSTWPIDSLPRVNGGFEGNLAGNGTPNDNNLAISNNGKIISVVNSNIYFYDTIGTELFNASLGAWTIDLDITNNKFDPKVIYDDEADRFVVVFLNGTSAFSSKYIACFSSSNDPMDPWNMYKLSGNPLNDTSWSDYPALSLSPEDLFLTINLLTPGQSWQTGFKQSVIWQIDKWSGYNGDSTLTTNLWTDIKEGGINIRNIHPVRPAKGVSFDGNDHYFLSNRNFATESDSIYLIHITDALSGNPSLTVELLNSSTNYYLNVDAPQSSGQFLATNDARVLGGIRELDYIQFVGNCTDTTYGNSAIYHGIIHLPSKTCTGHWISDSVLNLGYANIAGIGYDQNDQQSIISFEYSSATDFAGLAAVYYDGNGNYSPIKPLRTGDGYISVFNDPLERWGDYLGIQRSYTNMCEVWTAGTFGKVNHDNGTWVARIGGEEDCSGFVLSNDENKLSQNGISIYPNPTAEWVNLELKTENEGILVLDIIDINGKLVRTLVKEAVNIGNYDFKFNVAPLSKGVYVLRAHLNQNTIATHRFVKE